jgi:hypothetical protein
VTKPAAGEGQGTSSAAGSFRGAAAAASLETMNTGPREIFSFRIKNSQDKLASAAENLVFCPAQRQKLAVIAGCSWLLIGIGGHLAVPPLPHHRAYGSRTRRFD